MSSSYASSVNQNVAPAPGVASHQTSPRGRRGRGQRQPMPDPGNGRAVGSRPKMANAAVARAGSKPMPSSRTRRRRSGSASHANSIAPGRAAQCVAAAGRSSAGSARQRGSDPARRPGTKAISSCASAATSMSLRGSNGSLAGDPRSRSSNLASSAPASRTSARKRRVRTRAVALLSRDGSRTLSMAPRVVREARDERVELSGQRAGRGVLLRPARWMPVPRAGGAPGERPPWSSGRPRRDGAAAAGRARGLNRAAPAGARLVER